MSILKLKMRREFPLLREKMAFWSTEFINQMLNVKFIKQMIKCQVYKGSIKWTVATKQDEWEEKETRCSMLKVDDENTARYHYHMSDIWSNSSESSYCKWMFYGLRRN